MARSRARSGARVQAATAPSSRRIDSRGSPEVSLSRARIEARSVRSTARSCSTASAIASSATSSASPAAPLSMSASARRASSPTRSPTGASGASSRSASSVRPSRSMRSSVSRAEKAKAPSSSARSWSVGQVGVEPGAQQGHGPVGASAAVRGRRRAQGEGMRGCRVGGARCAVTFDAWRGDVGEREGHLVVSESLGRPTHPLRGITGEDRGLQGRRPVTGRQGVPRQVGGGAQRRVGAQRLDAGAVQLEALGGQQVVADRLGEQGMAELVALLPPRLEHVVLDGRPQRAAQRHGIGTGHLLEQGVRHPAADDGGDPHDGLRGVVEPVDPGEQQPGEVGRVGTAVAGGRGELLGEERVALGPPGDELDDVVVEGRAGAAHDPPQVGVGQRPEVDPGEPREARPHGEGAGQRVPPVHVVAAVRGEEGHPVGKSAGEEQGEQVAGRLVGPVHVLDDDEQRAAAPEVREGAVHGLDQVGAHGILAGPGRHARDQGHQPRVVGDQLVDEVALAAVEGREHLDERQVGKAGSPFADAVPDERAPVGGEPGEVPDHRRLADAGVATEEGRPTAPVGPAQGVEDAVDLLVATDQLGRGSRRHGADHGTRRRHEGGHGWRGRPVTTVGVALRAVS